MTTVYIYMIALAALLIASALLIVHAQLETKKLRRRLAQQVRIRHNLDRAHAERLAEGIDNGAIDYD